MLIILIVTGAVLVMTGLTILYKPEIIFGLITQKAESPLLHLLAIVVRIILGSLLIINAEASKLPFIIRIFGVISIVAALFLIAIGRSRFIRLMHWMLAFVDPLGRFAGLVVACFGIFLVYVFI